MVALDGHDPDPTFVDTPTSNDLAQPLNQAGAPSCGCCPKLAGSFQLKGPTNPSDKGKITDAIADAFAKENKGRWSEYSLIVKYSQIMYMYSDKKKLHHFLLLTDVDKKDIKADAKLNNTKSNG